MDRLNNSQLELFSKVGQDPKAKTQASGSFLRYIWKYEKAILIVIFFIITSSIAFSLGVEKGKKISSLKVNANFDLAEKASLPVPEVKPPSVKETNPDIKPEPVEKKVMQGYTVQVASFRTRTNAHREAEALRKKGFSSLVLSKGNFSIVCVGNFPNQKQAEPLLTKLKKAYQGSYIRRL